MNDPLTPQPKQTLPPEVRDRIRVKVSAGFEPALTSRTYRLRAPLAAAASVAVLAAGAMIVVQSVSGDHGGVGTSTTSPSTTSGATLNREKANAELDRCWAAVQRDGKAGRFPDRTQWLPVFDDGLGSVHVTATRAAGKPLFCETTNTRVTVSDPSITPAHASGTRTGAVLTSRLGTIAGVVDPSWPRMWTEPEGTQAPVVKDGLFLSFSRREKPAGKASIRVTGDDPRRATARWTPLPTAPPAAVSVVDRPVDSAPDRISDRGRLLDACIKAADATNAVIDAESWEPGAVVEEGDNRVVVMRNAYGFSTCQQVDGEATVGRPFGYDSGVRGYLGEPEAANGPTAESFGPTAFTRDPRGTGGRHVLTGAVPQLCARLEINAPGGVVEAEVVNSTFATLIPDTYLDGLGTKDLATVKLFDANNTLIYEGDLLGYY